MVAEPYGGFGQVPPWGILWFLSRDDFYCKQRNGMFCVMASYAHEERKKNKLFIQYKLAHVNDLRLTSEGRQDMPWPRPDLPTSKWGNCVRLEMGQFLAQ